MFQTVGCTNERITKALNDSISAYRNLYFKAIVKSNLCPELLMHLKPWLSQICPELLMHSSLITKSFNFVCVRFTIDYSHLILYYINCKLTLRIYKEENS